MESGVINEILLEILLSFAACFHLFLEKISAVNVTPPFELLLPILYHILSGHQKHSFGINNFFEKDLDNLLSLLYEGKVVNYKWYKMFSQKTWHYK